MQSTFQDARYLYIVMEFVEGGEFFTFLRNSKKLSDVCSRFYAAHVSLKYHQLGRVEGGDVHLVVELYPLMFE